MANAQGDFIWYELMTTDMDGARAFYEPVVGWSIGAESGMPGMDYRMIGVGDGDAAHDEDFVAGLMELDDEMLSNGGRPMWIAYIGVDDVDAMAGAIEQAGGRIFVPPSEIPGVGRFAMVADPQGAPFYIMRGASDESSTVFSERGLRRCGWNELITPDQIAAHRFYTTLFGWRQEGAMPMGDGGPGYCFLLQGETRIGATGPRPGGAPASWRHYFRVPSIDAAIAAVTAHGGTVEQGPHDVPGGDMIVVGKDPQGAEFALVGGA